MPDSILLFFAVAAYLIAFGLIAARFRDDQSRSGANNVEGQSYRIPFAIALAAAASHLLYAYRIGLSDGGINFSLSTMSAIVSGMLMVVYLLACLAMPIKRLGLIVFPLTALSVLFSAVWASEENYLRHYGPAFSAHVLVALLAYSLLAIASIQALLYVYQEKQLKTRPVPAWLRALPPLQTMEDLLFRLIIAGFALLSLTLLTGALFSQQIFGQPFEFNHHTVFALLGWMVFATLLVKRFREGLRGSQAVIWTLAGFILIQLGYFGTKIVSESLNIQ
ncbi:MAG: cytochrome c biogenesis protein CcsA [Pseudomonadota bacterium]